MNSQEHEGSGERLDSAHQTSEDIDALEAKDDGTRLSAVNRSVRLKQQRNWKWKWWCFTKGRVLQPISETAENPKDETSRDENVLPYNLDPESSGDCTAEQCENGTESNHETDRIGIQEKDMCVATETIITSPKDQYSACYKLIEKFQEAVLDNAVRIIQAAFKRFAQRRRFLRLKKAATVIQRNVRKWMQRRCPAVSNSKAEESLTVCCQKVSSVAKDVICKSSSVDDLETAVQADDSEVVSDKGGQEIENSESEFLHPDTWDNLPSPLQNLKLGEPDSVSLTDSGIDGCSVASVEAVIEESNPEFKACHHASSEELVESGSPVFGRGKDECQDLDKCLQESN